MKGIIFNLVEDVVTSEDGADAWDDLLDSADVHGAYTAVGSYSDEELLAIVQAASTASGQPASDVLRHIGRRSLPLLAQRFPEFFELHSGVRTFLPSLNSVIHPEVRKLYPGATPPHFDFRTADDGCLLMDYHSQRGMCAMAEGLTLGAGDFYGQTLDITQIQCKDAGAPFCTLRIAVG